MRQGQRKINKYTRYSTLFLSAFQAIGVSKMLAAHGIALDPGLPFYLTTALTLVTGTMFLMWLGEQATERGKVMVFRLLSLRVSSRVYLQQLVERWSK